MSSVDASVRVRTAVLQLLAAALLIAAAVAIAFGLALNWIKSANDLIKHGPSHTSCALGSVLGVTAACLLALVSLGALSRRTP